MLRFLFRQMGTTASTEFVGAEENHRLYGYYIND
jgi:hypothetical protein